MATNVGHTGVGVERKKERKKERKNTVMAKSASISQSPGLLITMAAGIPAGGRERAR
jgi:hypothetical protein